MESGPRFLRAGAGSGAPCVVARIGLLLAGAEVRLNAGGGGLPFGQQGSGGVVAAAGDAPQGEGLGKERVADEPFAARRVHLRFVETGKQVQKAGRGEEGRLGNAQPPHERLQGSAGDQEAVDPHAGCAADLLVQQLAEDRVAQRRQAQSGRGIVGGGVGIECRANVSQTGDFSPPPRSMKAANSEMMSAADR